MKKKKKKQPTSLLLKVRDYMTAELSGRLEREKSSPLSQGLKRSFHTVLKKKIKIIIEESKNVKHCTSVLKRSKYDTHCYILAKLKRNQRMQQDEDWQSFDATETAASDSGSATLQCCACAPIG